MGLVAVLSNIQTEALFQRLTRRDWQQVRRPPSRPRDRARDGKLKFGTVSRAVLAVLADALEDSGCDSADLVSHFRGPGPHVRGCWAVDLLLGKE